MAISISHHQVTADLPEEWWIAAGMPNFVRRATAYRCNSAPAGSGRLCLVSIAEIGPTMRAQGFPIFNDDPYNLTPARERVERILRGFVQNAALPPIQLAKQEGPQPFCLKDGLHRLYCSIAAGFTKIPAVKFVDLAAIDAGLHTPDLC